MAREDLRPDSSKWRTLVGEGNTIEALGGYNEVPRIGNVLRPPTGAL